MQLRHPDVAGAIAEESSVSGFFGEALLAARCRHSPVIHAYLLGGFNIVIDNHLATAGDECVANLYRREPVKMKMSQQLIGKSQQDVSDVFDAPLDVATAHSADRFGLQVDHEIHDRNIVRSEIPD